MGGGARVSVIAMQRGKANRGESFRRRSELVLYTVGFLLGPKKWAFLQILLRLFGLHLGIGPDFNFMQTTNRENNYPE